VERTRHLLRLMAASELARDGGAESIAEATSQVASDATPSRPDDLIDLVDANLRAATSTTSIAEFSIDVGSLDWQRARDILIKNAQGMMARAAANLAPEPGDRIVAEAVIIADGTRPSFELCHSTVSPTDPYMGSWGGQLATAELAGYQTVAAAIGRIQPEHGSAARFVGTGALVSVAANGSSGTILTNKHVIDDARNKFGVAMTQTGDGMSIDGVLEIDFKGEACSLDTSIFHLTHVYFPAGAGAIFAGIDAAVATIRPADAQTTFPAPIPTLSEDTAYANGAVASLATIGFPARPIFEDGDVDWDFVLRTLFGNRFGIKRLAPGTFSEPLGAHPQDTGKRAIGHDATTFGGSSGSPVFAWLDGGSPVFALHFAGRTEFNNYALSFAKEAAALKAVGLPLTL